MLFNNLPIKGTGCERYPNLKCTIKPGIQPWELRAGRFRKGDGRETAELAAFLPNYVFAKPSRLALGVFTCTSPQRRALGSNQCVGEQSPAEPGCCRQIPGAVPARGSPCRDQG